MHIARFAALAPGSHPVAVGLRALAALLDLLHLPNGQVLQPGLELEGLGLCQGSIRFALQPLCLPASRRCMGGDSLQGSGILPEGLEAVRCMVDCSTAFYSRFENAIELI